MLIGYRLQPRCATRGQEEHRYVCTHIFPRMGRIRSTEEIIAALRETK